MTTIQAAIRGGLAMGRTGWTTIALLALLGVAAAHAAGVLLDFALAITYPYELDYGEGIVWHQATMIPGPAMYPRGQDLPFIVFHYPPLYHLAARAALLIRPDFLEAGRLVSVAATVLLAATVTALVLTSTRTRRSTPMELGIAAAAGFVMLCLEPVRGWGMLMRVDMLALLLSLLGVLIGARAEGRFWGTTFALILCAASVFTKQTELAAGAAVFLLALVRRPRHALAAAAVAGGLAIAALATLQALTEGGFLLNIVGYNINRFALRYGYWLFWGSRWTLPLMVLMAAAAIVLCRAALTLRARPFWRANLHALQALHGAAFAQALLLLYFALATAMLSTAFKSGGSMNYLLEWLIAGCVLIGWLLIRLARTNAEPAFVAVVAIVAITIGNQPLQSKRYLTDAGTLGPRAALVQRIQHAAKPVASADMVLLKRAGKPVLFEPSIVTELAEVGRWDQTPLLEMIRSRAFAFMITQDDDLGGGAQRTAQVDAAMRQAYPRVERVTKALWVHSPAE